MLTDEQMKSLCLMLGNFPAFAEEKEAYSRLTADATKKQADFLEHVKARYRGLAGDPERRKAEIKLISRLCEMNETQLTRLAGFLEGYKTAETRCKNAD